MATKCRSVCLHLGLHNLATRKHACKIPSWSFLPNLRATVVPQMMWCHQALDLPLLPYCGYSLLKRFVAIQHVPQAWKTDLKEQVNNDETADPFSFGLAVFTISLFGRLFEKTLKQLPLLLTFVTDAQSLSCNVCHNCLTRWFFELHIACSIWTLGYARLHWSLSPSLILFPTIWIEDLVSRYIAWAGVFLPAHLVSISPAVKCKKSCHKSQYVTARLVWENNQLRNTPESKQDGMQSPTSSFPSMTGKNCKNT